jgi:hypothetical protein
MAPEDYRLNAKRCLGEANRLSGVLLKRGLLDMADAWLQLAYKAKSPHREVIIDADELERDLSAIAVLIARSRNAAER